RPAPLGTPPALEPDRAGDRHVLPAQPHRLVRLASQAMARFRLRSRSQVVERCQALRSDVTAALARLPSQEPAVVDAVWRGEALGTLLWSLHLVELPPYDRPFDTEEVVEANAAAGELRDPDELELHPHSARLCHCRP